MRSARLHQRLSSLGIAVALWGAAPVMAAEFTDNVPMPLVRALLTNPGSNDVRIYSDVPEGLPEFVIPANFSVLGGIAQNRGSRMILQTSATREDAIAALSDSLVNAGFVDVETLVGGRITGFVPSEAMLSRRNFCRDDVGYLTIMFTELAGVNQVSLGTSNVLADSGISSCAELAEPRTPDMSRPDALFSDLMQHMPVLEVPESANSSRPRPFLGTSGASASERTYETSSQFTSDMSILEVYPRFAQQIAAQGWALDGESTGQVSGSGNWVKIPDGDTYLHGLFSIVQSSEANFSIRFRLTKLSVER